MSKHLSLYNSIDKAIEAAVGAINREGVGGSLLDMAVLWEACFVEEGYDSERERDEWYLDGLVYLQRAIEYIRMLEATLLSPQQALKSRLGGLTIWGRPDLIAMQRDASIDVVDFTTGKDGGENGKELQAEIYHYLAVRRFGLDRTIRSCVVYLRTGSVYSVDPDGLIERVEQELSRFEAELAATKVFEPRRSPLCAFCEAKSVCPAWPGADN